jgi:hypothetical protein
MRYLLDKWLGGPQGRYRRVGDMTLLALPTMQPRFLGIPAHILAATSTEISETPFVRYLHVNWHLFCYVGILCLWAQSV